MKVFFCTSAVVLFILCFSELGNCSTFEVFNVGSDTAVGFTSSKLTERSVQSAMCTIETADVRILYGTSTAPTSSVGLYFLKNTSFRIDNQRHMETFKVISTSGTATISVLYEP